MMVFQSDVKSVFIKQYESGNFFKTSIIIAIVYFSLLSVQLFADNPPIKLHPNNNHYFEFRGEPTVLLTSAEHYGAVINLDFDYELYLDELEDKNLNYTRIFSGSVVRPLEGFTDPATSNLGPASGQLIAPWDRSNVNGYINGGNKFDLNNWDPAYFARLKDFLTEAGNRGIVVELTFFSVHYTQSWWNYSPMKSSNNINGIGVVAKDKVFTMENGNLMAAQEAMVIKIAQELQDYDNVIYEICNEPYTPDADTPDESDPELSIIGVHMDWQRRIAEVLDSVESTHSYKHLIAQNIDNLYNTITIDAGELTDAIDEVSIFNFHYSALNPTTVTNSIEDNYDLNKPIGCDETGNRVGQTADYYYRKQAWNYLTAGSALYNNLDFTFDVDHPDGNQNNPTNSFGGGVTLRTQLGILKTFFDTFDFINMEPNNYLPSDDGIIRSVSPPTTSLRCLANEGVEYIIYAVKGGVSQIDMEVYLPAGDYLTRWLNTKTGEIDQTNSFSHPGGTLTLESPYFTGGDIALAITSDNAISVSAGPDEVIVMPQNSSFLDGEVLVDGNPPGGNTTISWNKISGPGTVSFTNPTEEDTDASFSNIGTYTIELSATDNGVTVSDEMQMTVMPQNQDNSELLGHWTLDESTGTTAFDSSNGAHSGTLLGGFSFDNSSVSGQHNTALSFDGINDLIRVEDPSEGSLDMGTSSFTLSNWFYIPAHQYKWQYFLNKATGGWIGYSLGLDNTRKLMAKFRTSSENITVKGSVPSTGQWHHVAAVYDRENGQLHLYLDGELEASEDIGSGSLDNDYDFQIGAYGNSTVPSDFFKGNIDDPRVYDKALTATEVGNIFSPPANTAPVVNAGTDQSITLPVNAVNLDGTVTDDGLPSGSVTITWSKLSGPGTVTFSNASIEDPTASFSSAGTYILQLQASDGELSSTDNVQVIVNPSAGGNPELLGHWTLDETTGKTAFDSSDAGHNGTLLGGFSFDENSVSGQHNTALSFDGVNDLIRIEDPVDHTLDMGTSSFTLSNWFYISEHQYKWQYFLNKATGGWIGYSLGLDNTRKIMAKFRTSTENITVRGSVPSLGQWHHAAAVYDRENGQLHLYLDGELEASEDIGSGSLSNPYDFQIGAYGNSTVPSDFFKGRIDDPQVYDKALSATEVSNLYLPSGNTAPVVNAGTDQTITLPVNAVNLNGTVTDDGLPSGSVTITWSELSGPGTVTFSNTGIEDPTATFSSAGTYVLQLHASDGELSATDNVQVIVYPSSGGDPELLGHWTLDETTGKTAYDSSDAAHNGTLLGGFSFDNSSVSGQHNTALSFDGVNDLIRVEDPVDHSLDMNTFSFTLSNWFYIPAHQSKWQYFLNKATGGWIGYSLGLDNSNKIMAKFRTAAENITVKGSVPSTGQWHHAAAVYDRENGQLHLYLDGELEASEDIGSGSLDNPYDFQIGAYGNSTVPSDFFKGRIDDPRVYDKALSAAEIDNLYSPTGNSAPVVNAGTDQSITLPVNAVNLNGTVTDDGLPSGSVTITWSKLSGPGTVTFSNASIEDPTASFSSAGTYVLQLHASDGELSATDNVQIVVNPSVGGDPELLGHWTLDETTGKTAYDSSDAAHNGTLLGGFSFDNNSVSGQHNTALSFDGVNDLIRVEDPVDGSLDMGTSSFTLSNWFYIPAHQNKWQYFLNKATGGWIGYSLGLDNTRKIMAKFRTSTENITVKGSVPSTGQWHHAAAVYDRENGQLHLYLNGELEASENIGSGSLSNAYDFQIGAYGNSTVPSDFFKGRIDDARVYDKALSAAEIGNLYSPTGNSAPVVNAGTDQSITLPINIVNLNGTVTDDGLPNGSVTISWSELSGPGTVTFSNASIEDPTASFSSAGTYVLQLHASDGELSATDNVQIIVNPSVGGNPELLGHWTLDETTGTIAYDESSFQNDGDLLNGFNFSNSSIDGHHNTALSFDGVSDVIRVVDPVNGSLDMGTNNFTVSAWFGYLTLESRFQYLVNKAAGGWIGYSLGLNEDNILFAKFRTSTENIICSGSIPSVGVWHHAVAVYNRNANELSLYLDGVLESTVSIGNGNLSNVYDFQIGAYGYSTVPSDFFEGGIDDVKVFNEALSSAEVSNLYNATSANSEEDRLVYDGGNAHKLNQFKSEIINYPNPFSTSTSILFNVEETNHTVLKVYDSYGQEIATLFNNIAKAGIQYNVKFDAVNLHQGIFYYRLISGNQSIKTGKMLLHK